MKQGLSLGFSQRLSLTPLLQQSIRLLQLSSLELEQEVEQQLLVNPFLERADDSSERERFDSVNTSTLPSPASPVSDAQDDNASVDAGEATFESWDGDGSVEVAPHDLEWGGDALPASTAVHETDVDPLGGLSEVTSLQDHLKRQALHLRLSPTDAASLEFLIESLDERGFLTESLEELATSLSRDESDMERLVDQLRIAWQWLKSLDPCGVGASHVSECLRLQLISQRATLPPQVFEVAVQLLALPLEVLAKQQIKRLAQTCNRSEALIHSALQAIRACEPLPARRFAAVQSTIIVPDVFVRALGSATFDVQLNVDLMPRLKVDDITARLLKIHKARESNNEAMQQSLLEARGFIKAITQRFDTVLRVARAIVARQGPFLIQGAIAMRPLVLRDIADELGLHESTVSRVTTNKYMATPQGTLEFKYFFDASLGTDSGVETSGTAVRALIAHLIGAENKTRPLSDGKLATLLEAQGIECARRTVAKYREAMRIPVASLRRQ